MRVEVRVEVSPLLGKNEKRLASLRTASLSRCVCGTLSRVLRDKRAGGCWDERAGVGVVRGLVLVRVWLARS